MTKVIAVHSFKGGTGKTTLTANLAATLALHHRVGVMDLDLSGPGLHVLFGRKKGEVKATMTDIFLGDATPSDVIIDLTPRFPKMKGGLYFCSTRNKVEDMLRLLRSVLDVINNLSISVFVVDNPDSAFAHKINEAAEMLTNELAEATHTAN